MLVENHGIAPLYTLRKDHKASEDEERGPPVRPVCGAKAAYNSKLSYLISSLLKHLWKDHEHACENTEDMLAAIRDLNQQHIEGDIIIGSLDVKALYPSLDIEFTAEVVSKAFFESDFEVEGVNHKELSLYLAINKTEKELESLDLARFCPKRKYKTGRLTITGCAMNNKPEKRYEPWVFPTNTPNKTTTKKMMSEALQVAIKYIMQNHVYGFDNVIKRQTTGGPIGLDLTGELAAVFMAWWDREFLARIGRLGMEVLLYKRFVDDANLVLRTPKETTRLANNSSEEEDRVEVEESPLDTETDVHYMNMAKEIGNRIHPSIQLEMDCPSLHDDNKLPILDVKVWVEERRRKNKDGDDENTEKEKMILHEYYYKDVATRSVISARSAMPWKTKRTVITQEILRILLRCSPELPWETTTEHVSHFMMRLQYSGYNMKFRAEVTKSALTAYRRIVDKDKKGEQPLYRKKQWKRAERLKKRRAQKENWYKRGGYKSVIFVPATPHSKLRKRYEEEIKKTDLKIKVVETSGRTVKSIIQKSDPFKRAGCNNIEGCMVCEGGKGQCRREGVTYEIKCSQCECIYVGETARNAHSRGKEHMAALKKKDPSSVLWRHTKQAHSDSHTPPHYSMVVTGYHDNSLTRQISEAVRINHVPVSLCINNKQEWAHTQLVRTSLTYF